MRTVISDVSCNGHIVLRSRNIFPCQHILSDEIIFNYLYLCYIATGVCLV